MQAQEFISKFNEAFNARLSPRQCASIDFLFSEMQKQEVTDNRQRAYILATVFHECNFLSIRERRARPTTPEQKQIWTWQNRYWPSGYYGRGFSQLTWRFNYEKFSRVVGADLVKNPDLALQPGIGAIIIVYGMKHGSFTAGRQRLESTNRLSKYFPIGSDVAQWENARKIVNGTFMAEKVAEHAKKIFAFMG
jgi:putative chitinase